MQETLVISGLYSGPSPSAGLGVARSVKAAHPGVKLIGVDFWSGSSGLHHEVFDDVWIKPSWDLLEAPVYAAELRAELDRGSAWISTLDLEVAWATTALPPHPRALVPTVAALQPTLKPKPSVAEMLPFPLPPSMDGQATDEELYDFCRRHSFRVWLKGPYHEAVAVTTWRHLELVRAAMRARWQTDRLSLQAHVRGYEESICLAAVDGELVDAIYMKKRITTPEGKTWAGRVGDVPEGMLAPVERAIKALRWTGGAELELIRDVDDRLWLMEWNPRFPAWIHGATIAGRNLPGALVGTALGLTSRPCVAMGAEFTRVVTEIPTRRDLPLPLPSEPHHFQLGATGKYGAALSSVVPLLASAAVGDEPAPPPSTWTPETLQDLASADLRAGETPRRLFLPETAAASFREAARLATLRSGKARLRPAYSVKTAPDPEPLALARASGMLAECISMLEVKRSLATGWRPDEIVLNGPGKWWPPSEVQDGLRAVFCDSVEELERLVASGREDRVWGVRLKIPGFPSRFGIDLGEPDMVTRLGALIARFPAHRGLGVHVHLASTLVGRGTWLDAVQSALGWALALQGASGRLVSVFDVGGGFHPADFAGLPFQAILEQATKQLAGLDELYLEPGRALTQHTSAIVTTVLDVRRDGDELTEIVADACIAELPLASVYPHRVGVIGRAGELTPVARGGVRVLGRICMEDDVLASGLAIPETIAIGDRLVFADAGAYDRSMSYAFGRGGYAAH